MSHNCKKVGFATEAQALFYVDKLKNTSTRTIIPVGAYLCPICLVWHLTSKESIESVIYKKYETRIKEKDLMIENLNKTINELRNS